MWKLMLGTVVCDHRVFSQTRPYQANFTGVRSLPHSPVNKLATACSLLTLCFWEYL